MQTDRTRGTWLLVWLPVLLCCGSEASSEDTHDTTGALPEETWTNDPLCPQAPPAFLSWDTPIGCSPGLECRFDAVGCEPGVLPEIICRCDATGWRCGPWARNCLPVGTEASRLADGERPRPRSRPTAAACEDPRDIPRDGSCFSEGETSSCADHADCADAELCLAVAPGFAPRCECVGAECLADSDCATGEICACGSLSNGDYCGEPYSERPCAHRCVPASCTSDDDCPGGFCSPSFDVCGTRIERWACHLPSNDECLNDLECHHSDVGYGVCRAAPDGTWRCMERTGCEPSLR